MAPLLTDCGPVERLVEDDGGERPRQPHWDGDGHQHADVLGLAVVVAEAPGREGRTGGYYSLISHARGQGTTHKYESRTLRNQVKILQRGVGFKIRKER